MSRTRRRPVRRITLLAAAAAAMAGTVAPTPPASAQVVAQAAAGNFCSYGPEIPPALVGDRIAYQELVACNGAVGSISLTVTLLYRPDPASGAVALSIGTGTVAGTNSIVVVVPPPADCLTGLYSGSAVGTVNFLSGSPLTITAPATTAEVPLTCPAPPPPPPPPAPDPAPTPPPPPPPAPTPPPPDPAPTPPPSPDPGPTPPPPVPPVPPTPNPGPAPAPTPLRSPELDRALRDARTDLLLDAQCLSLISGPNGDAYAVLVAIDPKIVESRRPKPGSESAIADATSNTGVNGVLRVFRPFYRITYANSGILPDYRRRDLVRRPTADEMRALVILHELAHITGANDHPAGDPDREFNDLILKRCLKLFKAPA
jgi:hypothetical protein